MGGDGNTRYAGVYPVHPAGWPILGGATLGLGLMAIWSWSVALFLVPVWIWCIWFFRDPKRSIPVDPGCLVSPADGRIVFVGAHRLPQELVGPLVPSLAVTKTGVEKTSDNAGQKKIAASDSPDIHMGDHKGDHKPISGSGSDSGSKEEWQLVSIFMNIFNVHVNRIPDHGTITACQYVPGRFFNASLDKASLDNERMALAIRVSEDMVIGCVQIAGLIARRIEWGVRIGQKVKRGERFGIIRFGSRVDVYIPSDVTIDVRIGDRVLAGETIIARRAKSDA